MLVLWRRQARTLGCGGWDTSLWDRSRSSKGEGNSTSQHEKRDQSGRNLNAFPLPHRDAQGLKGGQTQGIVLKEYMCLVMRALFSPP